VSYYSTSLSAHLKDQLSRLLHHNYPPALLFVFYLLRPSSKVHKLDPELAKVQEQLKEMAGKQDLKISVPGFWSRGVASSITSKLTSISNRSFPFVQRVVP